MAITLPRVWLDTLTRLLARDEQRKRLALAQRLATDLLRDLNRTFARERLARGRRRRRQRINWIYPLILTADELWCPIDTSSLPAGVFTERLSAGDVVRSLCDHVRHEVRVDYLATRQICYVVRLRGQRWPAMINVTSAEIPPDAAPLVVPLGVDGEGNAVLADLADLKHLLVAGATGGGKTTLLNAILTTLASRNTPDQLELWLIDLKRTEFALYRPLLGDRRRRGVVRHIAVDPQTAIEVLDEAYREIVRRNSEMERLGVTNWRDLARLTESRLPAIVLVIDEYAILSTDGTKIGKQSVGQATTLLMTRIAALGRAAGVHIIAATQMVNSNIVSSTIRANFENRLSFSTADWRQSQLIVETSEADGLPPGRAILRREGRTSEIQCYYISPRQVKMEVARIAEFGPDGTGDDDEQRRFVRDALLLVTAAARHMDGSCSRDRLLAMDGIRGIISWSRYDEIMARLERDGVVERRGRGRWLARMAAARPEVVIEALYSTRRTTIEAPIAPEAGDVPP